MKTRRWVGVALVGAGLVVLSCTADDAATVDAADSGSPDAAPTKEGGDLDAAVDAEVADSSVDATSDAAFDASDAADAYVPPPCVYGTSVYTDISAGQGDNTGVTPSAVLDTVNGKLLVVTDDQSNGDKPALFRCNVDGTACTYTDISAGQSSGSKPSAVIDTVNGKLLVATAKPGLFRCNLDGTGCAYSDISAGHGGVDPSAVFDAVNGKLLTVTTDGTNMACRPALFRCSADGTGCAYSTAVTDQGCATSPSAVLDAVNGKLLAVASNNSLEDAPYVLRCNLDGTACTYSSLGVDPGTGLHPSAVLDAVNGKLLAATTDFPNSFKAGLIRCNVDGTGCALSDISAGQGANSGYYPSAVIDSARGKLLVATSNGADSYKPGLFRCNLDGTACTFTDISAGQGANSGIRPSAVLDAVNGRLLVVTQNNGKPALFSVCVR